MRGKPARDHKLPHGKPAMHSIYIILRQSGIIRILTGIQGYIRAFYSFYFNTDGH